MSDKLELTGEQTQAANDIVFFLSQELENFPTNAKRQLPHDVLTKMVRRSFNNITAVALGLSDSLSLKGKDDRITKLEEDNNDLHQKFSDAQGVIHSLTEELAKERKELEDQQKYINKTFKDYASLKRSEKMAKANVKTLMETVKALESELEKTLQKYSSVVRNNRRLEDELEELSDNVENYETLLREKESKVGELEDCIRNLRENVVEKLAYNNLEDKLKDVTDELEQCKEIIKIQKVDYQDMQAHLHTQIEEQSSKILRHRKNFLASQDTVKVLREDNCNKEKKIIELNRYNHQLEETLKEVVEEKSQLVSEAQEKIKKLEESLAQTCYTMEQNSQSSTAKINSLQEREQEYTKEYLNTIHKERKKSFEAIKQRDELIQKVSELKHRLSTLEETYTDTIENFNMLCNIAKNVAKGV